MLEEKSFHHKTFSLSLDTWAALLALALALAVRLDLLKSVAW